MSLSRTTVHVKDVKCSQSTISHTFSNGDHRGQTIDTLVSDLSSRKMSASSLRVLVLRIGSKYWCVDGHRRMCAIRRHYSGNYEFKVDVTTDHEKYKWKITGSSGAWCDPAAAPRALSRPASPSSRRGRSRSRAASQRRTRSRAASPPRAATNSQNVASSAVDQLQRVTAAPPAVRQRSPVIRQRATASSSHHQQPATTAAAPVTTNSSYNSGQHVPSSSGQHAIPQEDPRLCFLAVFLILCCYILYLVIAAGFSLTR